MFKADAPLALIFGLGTEKIRKMLLAYINIDEVNDENRDLNLKDIISEQSSSEDKEYLKNINIDTIDYIRFGYFEAICDLVYKKLDFNAQDFPDVIKVFKGSTDGLWRDLVARNKKVLVLKIYGSAKASKIPNDGETNEALGKEEINGKFLILNGLNFQSSNDNAYIVYVEL